MTFWDFFHTHPIHAWLLITFIILIVYAGVSDVVKALTFTERIDKLEKMANNLKSNQRVN